MLKEESQSLLKVIWWGVKFSGFMVLIWGVGDLLAEEQGHNGGQYIKAVVKIVVGSTLMGVEKLYTALEKVGAVK